MNDLKQRVDALPADSKAMLADRLREHLLAEQNQSMPLVEDERLVAYVVPNDLCEVVRTELREHVAGRLPEYMVPWTFLELPSLPLMPNGKVDRSALPDPTTTQQDIGNEFIEPRTDLERTIADIWVEQLGVECVGVRDEFFELGGNSLIAVRLFAHINESCQVNLRLSVLFENPTIEKLAIAIESERAKSEGSGQADVPKVDQSLIHIVEMNPDEQGTKTPLFLVAGMLGVVHNLQSLADRIGKGRRIYGMQARGLAGEAEPHTTLKEMADAYVEEVVLVQPKGPYLLGGFCSGGFVAMEIAKRLRARGEQIEQVVMLDTYSFPDMKITTLDKIRIHLQRLRRRGIRYPFQWARDRVAWEWNQLRRWLAGPTKDPAKRVAEAFYKATADYELKGYDGKVSLFRPRLSVVYRLGPGRVVDEGRLFLFEDNNLRSRIPNLNVDEVPGGDHDAFVLEPHVDYLADRVLERLDAS